MRSRPYDLRGPDATDLSQLFSKSFTVEVQFRAVDEPLSAAALYALAHPLRLSALLALEGRPRTPTELATTLGLSEPELMSHLHLLDAAGLTTTSPETRLLHVTSSGWTDVARRLQQLQDASAREDDERSTP